MRRRPSLCLRVAACLFPALLLAACGSRDPALPNTEVTISTAPEEGARVLIGGEERGLSPVTIRGLNKGWTDVIVQRDGYKRTVDRIEIREGDPQRFTISLDPLVGYLTLESQPHGAAVHIGGNTVGATPLLAYPLPVGKHAYELTMENHYPVTGEIEVQEDFRYERHHALRAVEATLAVLSRPTGATIWLNNERRQEKTPAKITLPPGLYIVGVHAQGYVQAEERVTLEPNKERTVELHLKAGAVPEGMVLVPAGKFIMGADGRAPDESPRREVDLPAFYIDKYEVTNAQFKAVFPNHDFPKGMEDFPVEGVSWTQATEYARAVGKRLPTEAEWEKAARGSDGREFPWGNEFNPNFANTREKANDATVKPGTLLGGVSPHGCFDMAGNVYEWTSNWYEAYPGNTQVTKDYGQVYRVLRGGSYLEPQFQARCVRRHFDRMDAKKPGYGFRCAMDVVDR